MDKEFLEDYHAKERDALKKFIEKEKENKEGILLHTEHFPSLDRFPKITDPITITHAYRSSVFGIVPFYGSVVVPLIPICKEDFKSGTGLSPEYIEEIVDFTKRTGKIQFILETPAITFNDLDYLAPIFNELRPPELLQRINPQIFNLKEYRKSIIEFDTLARLGYLRWLCSRENSFSNKIPSGSVALQAYNTDAKAYYCAKYLGYSEITDLVIDSMMVNDFSGVHSLLGIIESFIAIPNNDIFGYPHNYSKQHLSVLQSSIPKGHDSGNYEPTTPLPFEIGRFLLRKLAVWSDDFDACKSIIDYYGQSDLHKLMINLDRGIKGSDLDYMLATKEEMDEVLDNLWEDSEKIRKRKKVAEIGMPIGLAVLGYIASGFDGLGVLASLGYPVFDKILSVKRSAVSEEIAKIRQKSYLIGIHDFKTKYLEKLKGIENHKTT